MKIKIFKLTIISLLLAGYTVLFFSCGEEEINVTPANIEAFFERLNSASLIYVTPPKWLIDKINEIEATYSADISIIKVRIFKGEWKNRTVYFVNNNLHSCVLCEIYYEDGTKIIWGINNVVADSFCTTSENWVLIYEFGNGI